MCSNKDFFHLKQQEQSFSTPKRTKNSFLEKPPTLKRLQRYVPSSEIFAIPPSETLQLPLIESYGDDNKQRKTLLLRPRFVSIAPELEIHSSDPSYADNMDRNPLNDALSEPPLKIFRTCDVKCSSTDVFLELLPERGTIVFAAPGRDKISRKNSNQALAA